MKKSLKTLVSIVCTFAILMSAHIPALASSTHLGSNIDINESDRELIEMMEGMEFTDEEISYLMELEYERRENSDSRNSDSNEISLLAFPRSPYIGQKHTETYKIHWSTVNMTVFGIAGFFIGEGKGLAAALLLANAIFNEVEERVNSKGITVSIDYVYARNNDGVLAWNMGMHRWSYFF